MAICNNCGSEYSDKRAKLGYRNCLECGDEIAQEEIGKKKLQVAVPYNKGPYMLIISRKELTSLGKK